MLVGTNDLDPHEVGQDIANWTMQWMRQNSDQGPVWRPLLVIDWQSIKNIFMRSETVCIGRAHAFPRIHMK
jgi:hypothetical protein